MGAGARRIEAVTSGEAYALLHERTREAEELRAELERVRREAMRKPAADDAAGPDVEIRRNDGVIVFANGHNVNVIRADLPSFSYNELLLEQPVFLRYSHMFPHRKGLQPYMSSRKSDLWKTYKRPLYLLRLLNRS